MTLSPSTVPDGWAPVTLHDVCDTQLGKMLSKQAKTGRAELPYLRNQNVQWGRFDLTDISTMSFTDGEKAKFRLRRGDVLVCEGGMVGRAAVWADDREMYYQKALHRLRCKEGVSPEFIAYAFEHMSANKVFGDYSSGSTIAHLPQEDLRALPLLLPPSEEQLRIVAELDRRLSRVQAAQTGLELALLRLRRARVAVLQAAAAGALGPIDTDEEAGESLEQALEDGGLPYEQVAERPGWVRVRIDTLAKVGSGATPKRGVSRYWTDGDIPWVTSGQVTQGRVTEPAAHITRAALAETSVKLWPAGTLLVAMYGEGRTRGHCAELGIESTCNQACAAIALKPQFSDLKDFLHLVLDANYERNRVLGSGGVQENLNLGLIRAILVDVPPARLRTALVQEAARRISLLDAAAQVVAEQAARAAVARQLLLRSAMTGALVAHRPEDEPATSLVERFRSDQPHRPARRERASRESRP